MRRNQKKHAFTLVELIVVITILAILWTIAFISLQWYSAQARDSKRLSDISNIKKSVELFSLSTWKFPKPDDSFTVSYSWEILWYQWTVWDQVSTNVSRNLNEKPLDPSTGIEYTYSTTHSQTEYEVLGLYESDLVSTSPLFFAKATKSRQPSPLGREGARPNVGANLVFAQQLSASTQDYPKIDWNYNWIYIKTSSFYVPTPSIINAEIVSNDELDNDLIKSQIVAGWDNLPWISTWWLDVTFSKYEWTITSDSTDEQKSALVQAIKTAYSWSYLASETMYADILSRTSTWELVDFVDVVVLGRVEYTSSSNTSSSTSNFIASWDYSFTFTNSSDWIHEYEWYGTYVSDDTLYLNRNTWERTNEEIMSNPLSGTVTSATGATWSANQWLTVFTFNTPIPETWKWYFEFKITWGNNYWCFVWWINTPSLMWPVLYNEPIGSIIAILFDPEANKVFYYKNWVQITSDYFMVDTFGALPSYLHFTRCWGYTRWRTSYEWYFRSEDFHYPSIATNSWALSYASIWPSSGLPYYVTTSDTNQLDLSWVSQISSVDIVDNQPSWTSIKALVSFDWRTTWKKWDWIDWVAGWTLTDLQNGNTISEIEAWLTNFNITTETSLDFAFDLSITGGSSVPAIYGINVGYE